MNRRKPLREGGTIMAQVRLIEPEDGSVTAPLQKCTWSQHYEKRNEDVTGVLTPATDEPDPQTFRYLGQTLQWDGAAIASEDRSLPRPVSFAWEPYPDDAGTLTYYLIISRYRDLADPEVIRQVPDPRAEVSHLHIGTRYFWKVRATRLGELLAESPIWSFATNEATPRWIRVPGITNVRDIGGWSLPRSRMVRQGVVYRGSEMNNHLQITDEGRSVLVDDLGICTDIDLRRSSEEPKPVLDESKVQWINVPSPEYHLIFEEGAERVRRIFEVFADSSKYPILFHCWGGADRTGTITFVLNGLLGVAEEDLIRDYELTSLSIWQERSRTSRKFRALLDGLSTYGRTTDCVAEKARKYLLSIGLNEEAIEAIRAQLIIYRQDP